MRSTCKAGFGVPSLRLLESFSLIPLDGSIEGFWDSLGFLEFMVNSILDFKFQAFVLLTSSWMSETWYASVNVSLVRDLCMKALATGNVHLWQ